MSRSEDTRKDRNGSCYYEICSCGRRRVNQRPAGGGLCWGVVRLTPCHRPGRAQLPFSKPSLITLFDHYL